MDFRESIFSFILIAFTLQRPTEAADADSGKPIYYGFFFDDETATSITSVANLYLNSSIEQIPNFKSFLESASTTSGVSNILNYYTKPLDVNTQEYDPHYHVTTKYCGNTDCSLYEKKVSTSIGKAFEMQLIGFFFTNRTFGIRVKLTPQQLELFDNDTKKPIPPSPRGVEPNLPTQALNSTFPGLAFVSQVMSLKPTKNKPHVTVGCAPKISAEVTGTDLLEIIEYEQKNDETLVSYFNIVAVGNQSDFVIQYGASPPNAFVIYPEMMILANATFESYNAPASASSVNVHNLIYLTFLLFLCMYYPNYNKY